VYYIQLLFELSILFKGIRKITFFMCFDMFLQKRCWGLILISFGVNVEVVALSLWLKIASVVRRHYTFYRKINQHCHDLTCITDHPGCAAICLKEHALEVAYLYRAEYRNVCVSFSHAYDISKQKAKILW